MTAENTVKGTKTKSIGNKEFDQKTDLKGSCFVMMPFKDPIGSYYEKIYEPAIKKADLKPIRADDSIFVAGAIIDKVWSGIEEASHSCFLRRGKGQCPF